MVRDEQGACGCQTEIGTSLSGRATEEGIRAHGTTNGSSL